MEIKIDSFVFLILFIILLVISSCEERQEIDFDKILNQRYGITPSYCSKPVYCGNLAMINCHAEVDGPLFYLDRITGNEISKCGGYCMTDDPKQGKICQTMCPPKEWTCD